MEKKQIKIKMRKLDRFNSFKINEDVGTDFMDLLHGSIQSEIKPLLPKSYNISYKDNEVLIGTGDDKDLNFRYIIEDDKFTYDINPRLKPDYGFSLPLKNMNIDSIISTIKNEIDEDPNNGLHDDNKEIYYEYDTEDESEKISDDININKPILDKPKRRKRSININVIQNVLEDAYILDDIDLKDVTVKELIRRMLLESR